MSKKNKNNGDHHNNINEMNNDTTNTVVPATEIPNRNIHKEQTPFSDAIDTEANMEIHDIEETETDNTETPNTETPNTETPNTETPKIELQDANNTIEPLDNQNEEMANNETVDKKKSKKNLYKGLRIIFSLGFFIFTGLFLNEVLLQPYLANKANDKAKSLFQMPTPSPVVAHKTEDSQASDSIEASSGAVTEDPVSDRKEEALIEDTNRDYMGRLLDFRGLLEVNPDVKGWIKLNNLNGENDTKIDYVVVQSGADDPEYYLTRDWLKNKIKSGSLFLDVKSSVEKNTQNLVIHGHNMTSTDDMFHYLLRYNKKEFYDSHPIIDFNTIYQTGQWKVFAVVITNGSSEKEPLFDYTKSEFKDSSDFMNFVYQLRIRSIYNADDIDIKEDDQLLTLSTCSYEVKDYRTVIVARKVRDGEDPSVNTDLVYSNPEPLYPPSFYYRYGGKAPKLTDTFEEALEAGEINWYQGVQ